MTETEIESLRKENESLKTENHALKVLRGNHHYKLDNGFAFFTSDPNQEKHKDIIEAINEKNTSALDQEDQKRINASRKDIQKAQEKVDLDSKPASWITTLRRFICRLFKIGK